MRDLISRQTAIDAMRKLHADDVDTYGAEIPECFDDKRAINALGTLPAVDPVPRWIPCSERLPEEDTDVLIAYRYKEGEGDTTHSYIEIASYGDMYFGGNPVHDSGTGNRVKHWRPPFAYFVSNYEVIAWMPLPEPYKEGENG